MNIVCSRCVKNIYYISVTEIRFQPEIPACQQMSAPQENMKKKEKKREELRNE